MSSIYCEILLKDGLSYDQLSDSVEPVLRKLVSRYIPISRKITLRYEGAPEGTEEHAFLLRELAESSLLHGVSIEIQHLPSGLESWLRMTGNLSFLEDCETVRIAREMATE